MLIKHNRHKIYFDLTGPENGAVVAFGHSLASDSGMWAEQMPALLAAGYRVLRIDMRGHGGSEPVPGNYTMKGLGEDFVGVCKTLGLADMRYVGLSIGGMIGQELAIRHADLFRSVMLCDTAAGAIHNAEAVWGPRVKIVADANSVAPLAEPTMQRWFQPDFKTRNPKRWQQIYDTIANTTPWGYCGCAHAIQTFDFRKELSGVKIPALVVCGANDPAMPPPENKEISDLIPGAKFAEIPASQHLPNVEQPDDFTRVMMDWLKAH